MRLMTVCLAFCFALSCSQTTATSGTPLAPGMARLELKLGGTATNSPANQAKQVNVTVARVTAHSREVGWVEVFNGGPVTVDLLTLATRTMDLGFSDLPPGRINQIRLYLQEGGTQNVVLASGEVAPLKVPSGVQSGIKIKGPFDLGKCDSTSIELNFDGHKSIWYHPTGHGGDWVLRPVIHTKNISRHAESCDGPDDGGESNHGRPGHSDDHGGGKGTCDGGRGNGNGGNGHGHDGDDDDNEGDGGTDLNEVPGATCALGTDCLSGVCTGGVCAPGAQGTPCISNTDCASQVCNALGSCDAPVTTIPTLPAGSPCQVATQCTSGVCAQGVCDPGIQGQPCLADVDCEQTYLCFEGFCEPQLN